MGHIYTEFSLKVEILAVLGETNISLENSTSSELNAINPETFSGGNSIGGLKGLKNVNK